MAALAGVHANVSKLDLERLVIHRLHLYLSTLVGNRKQLI